MRLRIVFVALMAITAANAAGPKDARTGSQKQTAKPDVAAANATADPSSSTTPAASLRSREALLPAEDNAQGDPADYRIGAGDVLQVSVWKQPEVSVPSVTVRPDGRIAVPLIKDVEVAGLTPREAEHLIAARLGKLIAGVDVTVVVTTINSKKIYVMGAVKKEGAIPYSYRMTVLQALSEAGGLGDFASRKKIYVLRTVNGQSRRLPFNYDKVIKGRDMEENVVLLPGDTVVIPD